MMYVDILYVNLMILEIDDSYLQFQVNVSRNLD